MSAMIEMMQAAKATMDGDDDNLCQALMMLAAARQITIVPQPNHITLKPVIMVPQRIYNRMIALSNEDGE